MADMTLEEFRRLGREARFRNTTPEQRSASARHAVQVRWERTGSVVKAAADIVRAMGHATPISLAERLGVKKHVAGERLRKAALAGLIVRKERGLYVAAPKQKKST